MPKNFESKIPKPDLEEMQKEENVVENIITYVLKELYYIENHEEERDKNIEEIINEQKSKIDTTVLINLEVNFSNLYSYHKNLI